MLCEAFFYNEHDNDNEPEGKKEADEGMIITLITKDFAVFKFQDHLKGVLGMSTITKL